MPRPGGCKGKERASTHYDGAAAGLAVDVLVTQVEDQRGSAIKKAEHAHTHEELRRGGEVALQVGHVGWSGVTRRYLVGVRRQPEGTHRGEEQLSVNSCSGTFYTRSDFRENKSSPQLLFNPRRARRENDRIKQDLLDVYT